MMVAIVWKYVEWRRKCFSGKKCAETQSSSSYPKKKGQVGRTVALWVESVFPLVMCDCALYEVTEKVEASYRLCSSG